MANSEACQVYIEQEIKEGLAQGKTPYSIGKDLSAWVEKLFETSIPADTLRKRAERIGTNVHTPTTPLNNLETEKNLGGRPLKYAKVPEPPPKFTNAMHIATFVIIHLERIAFDDPKREEALQKVNDWIEQNL
jgi:hypothetical protein